MIAVRLDARFVFALVAIAAASCSGGGGPQGSPPLQSPTTQQVGTSAQSYQLSGSGVTATLTLRASTKLPSSSITLHNTANSAHVASATAQSLTPQACPSIPPIDIVNPFPFPITIDVDSFVVKVPCSVEGLFGATFFQLKPVPPPPNGISPVKLGNATASGDSTISFTSSVTSFTLAARSLSEIVVLPESSTSEVGFPVVPGATTNLTSSSGIAPSLTFTYSTGTSTGGSLYSVICSTNTGSLTGRLVGTPAFFCQLIVPNNGSIQFGQVLTFVAANIPGDRAIFEPDGAAHGFLCTNTATPSCNSSPLTVSNTNTSTTYENFIIANVQDLRMCVPSTPNTDCNNFDNDPQTSPLSAVSLSHGDFQLLVADDPTYTPNLPQWKGTFTISFSPSTCAKLDMAPDDDNGDVPPGYTDENQEGIGPAAEFDVTPLTTGPCTLTATEGVGYIEDDSNPASPVPRTTSLPLTINE
jgi:hypothetical protein